MAKTFFQMTNKLYMFKQVNHILKTLNIKYL